jgi:hypothetical protein
LHESNGGNYEFKLRRVDNVGWGHFYTANGSTTISAAVPFTTSTLDVSSTGAPSGASAKLEVYKVAATQNLEVKNNTAGPVTFEVIYNPA